MENIIGFVFGGKSAEREISIVTMLQIKNMINSDRDIVPKFIYYDENGIDFYLIDSAKMTGEFFANFRYSDVTKIYFSAGGEVYKSKGKIKRKLFTISAAVNCCHGGGGEDGALAGFMKTLGIPFSSFNHTALGVSMDKNLFRLVMLGAGISVAPGFAFSKNEYDSNPSDIIKKVCKFKFPVIVKPNASGSSLGVNKAESVADFTEYVALAFLYDNDVVVEKFIQNKQELNVAVVGSKSEGYIVSEVDEVNYSGEVFSFDDKYIKNDNSDCPKSKLKMENAKRNLPANINNSLKELIQKTGKEIALLLGICGIARIDFMFDRKAKKLYVIECNSVPGSLALYFFLGTSLEKGNLIKKLVSIAQNEQKNQIDYAKQYNPKIF